MKKNHGKVEDLDFFFVDNYIVFYIVNNDAKEVNVLRVLYGRMDFSKIWN